MSSNMLRAELANCIETLKSETLLLAEQYGIVALAIFGSVARQENDPKSDIDILIDFKEVPSFLL
jgi:predicted nucleotidyltransferase